MSFCTVMSWNIYPLFSLIPGKSVFWCTLYPTSPQSEYSLCLHLCAAAADCCVYSIWGTCCSHIHWHPPVLYYDWWFIVRHDQRWAEIVYINVQSGAVMVVILTAQVDLWRKKSNACAVTEFCIMATNRSTGGWGLLWAAGKVLGSHPF